RCGSSVASFQSQLTPAERIVAVSTFECAEPVVDTLPLSLQPLRLLWQAPWPSAAVHLRLPHRASVAARPEPATLWPRSTEPVPADDRGKPARPRHGPIIVSRSRHPYSWWWGSRHKRRSRWR